MREEKQLLLDEIKEKIEGSNGFVVTSYKNLTALRSRALRDTIAEAGGEFEVVRKRVFIKAAEAAGLRFEFDKLKGHVGVVFAKDDATALAKGTVKYGEDNDKSIVVLGGLIDQVICSAEEVEAIAKLPSLPELRAQLLGLFEAPMSQTVGVMQSMLTSVLYCMDAKGKKE